MSRATRGAVSGFLGESGTHALLTTGAEIAARAVGLLTLSMLARHLPQESFGSFNTLLAYYALALTIGSGGLDHLIARDLSTGLATAEKFRTLLMLRVFASVAAGGLLVGAGSFAEPGARAPVMLLGIGLLPAGLGAAFTSALRARERFGVVAGATIAASVAFALLTWAGIAAGAHVAFFVAGYVAADALRALFLAVAAWGAGLPVLPRFNPAFARAAARASAPYGLLAVLGMAYLRVDLIMIERMLGPREAGIYAACYRIVDALVLLPGIALGVVFPRVARALRDDPAGAAELYLVATRAFAWAGVVVAGIGALLARPLLTALFSDAYADAAPTLRCLMVALVFVFWHAPNGTFLFASERLRNVVLLSGVSVLMNVALNLVLIPRMGGAGAALATAASEAAAVVLFAALIARRLPFTAAEYLRAIASPLLSRRQRDLLLARGADRHGPPPAGERIVRNGAP